MVHRLTCSTRPKLNISREADDFGAMSWHMLSCNSQHIACQQSHGACFAQCASKSHSQYTGSSPHRLMMLLTHDSITLAMCKHCKLTSLGPIVDHCTEAFLASLCSVQAFWFDYSAEVPTVLHMAWSAGREAKQVHLAEQPCLPRVSDDQAEAHADQNIWTVVSSHLCSLGSPESALEPGD